MTASTNMVRLQAPPGVTHVTIHRWNGPDIFTSSNQITVTMKFEPGIKFFHNGHRLIELDEDRCVTFWADTATEEKSHERRD